MNDQIAIRLRLRQSIQPCIELTMVRDQNVLDDSKLSDHARMCERPERRKTSAYHARVAQGSQQR